LQRRALAEQEELAESDLIDFYRQIPTCPIERGGRTPDDLRGPLEVRSAAVSLFERAEQGVVVQPVRLRLTELFDRRLQVLARAGAEVPPSRLEQRVFESLDGIEIDRRWRKRAAREIARANESVLDQPLGADQQRVARERRQGLVRRVAIAGRPQRERLPISLSRLVKPVDPGDGRRAYVADSVRRRQRRDVQQDAGSPVVRGERGHVHLEPPIALSTRP